MDRSAAAGFRLARFHEFIRCTNQIELLIRDSEIFSYCVADRAEHDGAERLVITEGPCARQPMGFCEVEGGLVEFLLREIESGKRDSRLVVLTDAEGDALTLPRIEKADCWTVESVDAGQGRIGLVRVTVGRKPSSGADSGAIRTWGMFGHLARSRAT